MIKNSNFLEVKELDSGFTFHVQFHITNACNLRCKHCYEGKQTKCVHWDFQEFKSAIDKLWSSFQKWGVKGEISLIGGEPTLHPDFDKIVRYLYERDDVESISILTNGVVINPNLIGLIKECNCFLQVSIDGINEEKHDEIRGKGNYAKLMANVETLVREGIHPSAHYVLSKQTTPLTKDFFVSLAQKGIKLMSFSRLVPMGNAMIEDMLSPKETKETMEMIDGMKQTCLNNGLSIRTTRPLWCNFGSSGRCPVGIQTITILENGDVLPCRRLPIVLGNIKSDSFYKIWYTSKVLNDLRNRKNIGGCGRCEMLDYCGGARCIAYAVYGDYMKKDPQCWK